MPLLILAISLGIAPAVRAIPATDFLNSIGVNSAVSVRGESLAKTIECTKYLGIRWFRAGNESGPVMADLLELHKQTGARLSWGLASGGTDLTALIQTGKQLAKAGALLAFEGSNEPNNWGVTYKGETGGRDKSWVPVASLQRDLYAAVKGDPELKSCPIWGVSECGAEVDNVGLQFLTVPEGAGTVVPAGTKYSDFANVHNYIYHPNAPGLEDNKTWKASDPSSGCKVDGLYGEYGLTWGRHYAGYSEKDLLTLPRVTTETGCNIEGAVTEEIHGLNLMSLYLDQFKRGWSNTAVYLLRDRVDEGGNQQFGFYKPDYTPRKAAVYLHNLTAILGDKATMKKPGQLQYSIPNQPDTVHDMLLQKSDGSYSLVVWSELVNGTNEVDVQFGNPHTNAQFYDPTLGTTAIATLQNVPLIKCKLTNHPIVIRIRK